jgi:hypothetical protein
MKHSWTFKTGGGGGGQYLPSNLYCLAQDVKLPISFLYACYDIFLFLFHYRMLMVLKKNWKSLKYVDFKRKYQEKQFLKSFFCHEVEFGLNIKTVGKFYHPMFCDFTVR